MIWGRPTNLWLGVLTAIVGAVQLTLVALGFDPTIVATLAGGYGAVGGAVIALVAYQPPVVTPGTDVTVQTPAGQPNATATLGLNREGEVTVSQ